MVVKSSIALIEDGGGDDEQQQSSAGSACGSVNEQEEDCSAAEIMMEPQDFLFGSNGVGGGWGSHMLGNVDQQHSLRWDDHQRNPSRSTSSLSSLSQSSNTSDKTEDKLLQDFGLDVEDDKNENQTKTSSIALSSSVLLAKLKASRAEIRSLKIVNRAQNDYYKETIKNLRELVSYLKKLLHQKGQVNIGPGTKSSTIALIDGDD